MTIHNSEVVKKRKFVPKKIKILVWDKYIGEDVARSKCMCCRTNIISMHEFDCAHVIAVANGGSNKISNLRPICHMCNLSMNTQPLFEFQEMCSSVVDQNIEESSNTSNRQSNRNYYTCPRCNYSVVNKYQMRNHLHRVRKCKNENNLELTEEIIRIVLEDHIYRT